MIACSSLSRVPVSSKSFIRRSQLGGRLSVAAEGPIYFPFHKRAGDLLCLTPSYRSARMTCFAAARNQSAETRDVYQGLFGPWSLDPSDIEEVTYYRIGLSIAAAAFVVASLLSFIPPESSVKAFARSLENPLAVVGAGGLGTSLTLIHIYVTPLKRFLQALWGVGVLGGLALMLTQDVPVIEFVATHRAAVWLIGPFFAAVTGVAFKEGLCYGKPECAALFFVTPALLLGHLTGWLPAEGERALLLLMCALAFVFAGRKYTQPIKDDIGDKSVFMYQALPEEQQQKWGAARGLKR